MDTLHSSPDHAVLISRVAEHQWHAIEDDQVVGRGHASRRPDGRLFVSVDAWRGPVFDRLAAAMLAGLPAPLYAVVDEADHELTDSWQRAGFTVRRREWDYAVPTDPRVTGLDAARTPPGITILPAGEAAEAPLSALDRVIRDEVEIAVGWDSMPAEVLPRPSGAAVLYPERYAVAARSDRYVGLVRVTPLPRRPRIGLIAVRADEQRHGIARALLAHVLGVMHEAGTAVTAADIDESNRAAAALFEGVGASRVARSLELVRR
jgi:ribosomal protein S18 acetylase RimI-like enzyme